MKESRERSPGKPFSLPRQKASHTPPKVDNTLSMGELTFSVLYVRRMMISVFLVTGFCPGYDLHVHKIVIIHGQGIVKTRCVSIYSGIAS